MTYDDDQADQERKERIRHVGRVAFAFVMLIGAIVVVGVDLNSCETADADALAALRSQGLHHVHLGGSALMRCDGTELSRSFTAINQHGDDVAGVVCCGFISKGCTIRW